MMVDNTSKRSPEVPTLWIFIGFILVFIGVALYCFKTGFVIFMNDSYLLADRAKHLIYEGTLNSEQSLIYPPLYPFLICPAYFTSNPHVSHTLILLMNVLVYSSSYFPIFLILKSYTGMKEKQPIILGILLTLAPFSLPYASMFLYDALSYPIFLWFSYFTHRLLTSRRTIEFTGAGIFLALSVLTKDSYKNLVLCFFIVSAIDLIQEKRGNSGWIAIFKRYQITYLVFIGIYGSWTAIEHFLLTYPADRITYWRWYVTFSDLDIRFSWLSNILFYYLTSPLSFTTLFALYLFFSRPKLILEDLFVTYAFLCAAGAALSTVILMPSTIGTADLNWNRYQALYVILFIFPAFRYLRCFDSQFLKILGAFLVFIITAGIPAKLGCHFPDSLVLFMKSANERVPAFALNFLYGLVLIGPPLLLLANKRRGKTLAISFLFFVYILADVGAYLYWKRPNNLHIESYKGIYQVATEIYIRNRHISLYSDSNPCDKTILHLTMQRYRFYFPFFVKAKSLDEVKSLAKTAREGIFFLTDRQIYTGAKKIAEDAFGMKLYHFTEKSDLEANEFVADAIAEASPADLVIEGMRPFPEGPYPSDLPRVRWANNSVVRLVFNNTAELNLKSLLMAMSFRPHGLPTKSMSVMFNGKIVKEYQIQTNWQDDHISLLPQKGLNTIELIFEARYQRDEALYLLFRTLSLHGTPNK